MSVVLAIVLVEAASAGLAPPWELDPNGFVRLDPNALSWDWASRLDEETYRQDGAEIVPWTQETALPSPDNAALLYYQAFLLRPEPDDAANLKLNDILRDGLPDTSIRVYLGRCREMIHTVETASLVSQCTWGIRHLDSSSFSEAALLGELRQVACVLAVDARTLAVDGHYDAAFARCLTLRRMARHAGDETVLMLLVSQALDALAQRAAQYALGVMPPNTETLQALRGQLGAAPGAIQSIEKTLQSDLETILASLRRRPDSLDYIRQQLAQNAPDESTRQIALSLTDDEVLARAKAPSSLFLNSIFRILDSDMLYEQKYAGIEAQKREFVAEYGGDPAGGMVLLASSTSIVRFYGLSVRHTAAYSALKTAIEIYLAYAEAGRLPEALPACVVRSPYSGQDFEYEITATGFILRCRAQDFDEKRTIQYEFTVHR